MCYGQILESGLRKTRKQRKCDECGREIKVGELREHQVQKDDGELVTLDWCLRCAALGNEAADIIGDACVMGEVRATWRDAGDCGYWRTLRKQLRANIAAMLERHKSRAPSAREGEATR